MKRLMSYLLKQYVGQDSLGNRYYETTRFGHRRWVKYKGLREASKVPPQWHAWLHKSSASPLSVSSGKTTPHIPNLTGTSFTYKPSRKSETGRMRESVHYFPWFPS